MAGLNAARVFYGSNKSADDVFADPAKVTAINAALTAARTAYENNAGQGPTMRAA